MNVIWEVRTPAGGPIFGLVTDRPVVAVLDRTEGTLTIGEADKAGRLLPKGLRESCGFDPLAPVPVLIRTGPRGGVTEWPVQERGEAHPSTVLLPGPDGE
jgi:hypothetical protein